MRKEGFQEWVAWWRRLHVRKIREYSDAVIFNGYGPTETTCGVLYSKIEDETHITIGKPIANTKIYIVDKYLHLTPIGVTGEIYIAGNCVGKGYLNRPELTDEKFIDNPFASGKLYRTGDMAYWRDSEVNRILARNNMGTEEPPEETEMGNILLAGAIGYLGIHILADFLEHDKGFAYCLVYDLLQFYFQ